MSRVAIVAVHGVGSPPQFETARSVADLLVQHAPYSEFHERHITIPTAPVVLSEDPGQKPAATSTPGFAQRATSFAPGDRDRTEFSATDATAFTDLDVAFMRDLLLGYEKASDKPPYKTIEIVGERSEQNGGATTKDEVHVFEMHWADLSRVGKGLFRVLGSLYQLVLHIAHLGRKTLDLAANATALGPLADEETVRWQRLASAHAWVVRLFTVAVPMSTLLIFASTLLFVPDAIPPGRRLLAATIMLELIILIGLGVRTYFNAKSRDAAGRFVGAMGFYLALGILANLYADRLGGDGFGAILLGVVATGIVVAAFAVVANRYDRIAPGALPWGVSGLVVALIGTAFWAPRFMHSSIPAEHEGLRFAALAGFQFGYITLMIAWGLIWLAALATAWRAIRLRALMNQYTRPRDSHVRALRAMWTAKVTLAVALFGFIITALVSYQALTVLAWRSHGSFNVMPSIAKESSFPLITRSLVPPGTSCPAIPAGAPYDGATCANRFFEVLIGQSATVGLPIAMATVVVALLLVSWFIALVAVTSVHKPKSPTRFALHVGNWVADGFEWLHRAGSLLVFGLGLAITVGFVAQAWQSVTGHFPAFLPGVSPEATERILGWLAVTALATTATFAAARVRLAFLASRARPAIGIILDVDNYLREAPPERTPRAKIAERFTSLLRHIVERKDADGRRYFDRIVIVSHSQGTVISADLLRFLTVAGVSNPDLTQIDVRLMTMGSPLRQLYSVHFPHLYDWIDRSDDHGDGRHRDDDLAFVVRGIAGKPVVNPDPTMSLPLTELSPSPLWLRVSQWVNLYTSGDYVGRSLWRTDDTDGVWAYEPFDAAATGAGRRERCLGDGTHTRYWIDGEVAKEIDAQVAMGVAAPQGGLRTPNQAMGAVRV